MGVITKFSNSKWFWILGGTAMLYNWSHNYQADHPASPPSSCFSAWDGTPIGFKDKLGDDLRDPDSFQLIRATHDDADHTFDVKFRAKNGFGGFEVSEMTGTVDAKCNISFF